jgi:hypothetical protein
VRKLEAFVIMGLGLASAATARANGNPLPGPPSPQSGPCLPTLDNCQNPATYQSCPAGATATCPSVIDDAFSTDNQANPNARVALAPPGTQHAGQLVNTKYYAFDPVASHLQLIGATDGYHGSSLNHRAWVQNPAMNGVLGRWIWGRPRPHYTDPQAPWASDGNRVASCEEYAYKRYSTMSHYEDFVASVNALDYMSILRGAYMTALIYGNDIVDEQGQTVMNWSLPAHAKNIYFELPINNLPLRTFNYDPVIVQHLSAVGNGPSPGVPTDANGLWGAINGATAKWGGDLLEQNYQDMKKFRLLMKGRAQLVAMDPMSQPMCQALPPWLVPWCLPEHNAIVQLVYNVDAQLNNMLEGALWGDCMSDGSTPCDLSPHQLVDEIHESIDAQREPDYQQCLRLTGNAFGSGSLVQRVSAGSLASYGIAAADYAGTSGSLKSMLNALSAQVSAVQLPIDPKTGQYTLGDEKSDYQSWGSDWFGANYAYDAAWHVTDLANKICNANLHLYSSLSVNGSILTTNVSVVDFMAAVDTAGTDSSNNTVTEQSHFKLLGSDIYTPVNATQPLNFNIALGGIDTGDKNIWTSPPIDIPIGPIQVFVSGGIAGGVGVDGGMSGGLSRDCNANTIGLAANSDLAPFAHLEGFGQAALGVPSLLEVGVRGKVTLVKAGLPLNAGLSMQLDGSGNVTLKGGSSLYLDLSTFGGAISVFLDSLFGSTEKEIITWKGYELSQKLFDLSFATPIAVSLIQLKLAQPPGAAP